MKVDYRRTTEWKTDKFLFPKPLETLHTDMPEFSESIIEYSKYLEVLEYRKQALPNFRKVTIYRRPGSTWEPKTVNSHIPPGRTK